MSQYTTNGHSGRIEQPVIREARLRRDIAHLGTLFGVLALSCELLLDAQDDAPCNGKEG